MVEKVCFHFRENKSMLSGFTIKEQECIPVGCVPSAAVAISPAMHIPLPCTPPAMLPLPHIIPGHICPLPCNPLPRTPPSPAWTKSQTPVKTPLRNVKNLRMTTSHEIVKGQKKVYCGSVFQNTKFHNRIRLKARWHINWIRFSGRKDWEDTFLS